jgi:hypothetical protein
MAHIIRLIEDHNSLHICACTLAISAESPSPFPETAFDELQRFRLALNVHLAEEAHFMAGTISVGRAEFARHADAHRHRFADLIAEWETYLGEWNGETIGADWHGFGGATRWIMGCLREQMRAENAVLYPLAMQHGLVTPEPALN